MARAHGSYPWCHWFESNYSHHHGPLVKRPKTPPFHGGNTSSNLVRVTKKCRHPFGCLRFFLLLEYEIRKERSGKARCKLSSGQLTSSGACRRRCRRANLVRVTKKCRHPFGCLRFFLYLSTRFEKNGRAKPDVNCPVDSWQVRVRVGGVAAERISYAFSNVIYLTASEIRLRI